MPIILTRRKWNVARSFTQDENNSSGELAPDYAFAPLQSLGAFAERI
jgi:hypothetical protein